MDFTDQDALDAIARLMNGNEWDSELISSIAEIIHATGRPLKEPTYFHNTTLIPDWPMTQHRIYFTETNSGYITCDSEEHAKQVQQDLDDGIPIDEIDGNYKYTEVNREWNYRLVPVKTIRIATPL